MRKAYYEMSEDEKKQSDEDCAVVLKWITMGLERQKAATVRMLNNGKLTLGKKLELVVAEDNSQ